MIKVAKRVLRKINTSYYLNVPTDLVQSILGEDIMDSEIVATIFMNENNELIIHLEKVKR
jgi:hypothetical protein